MAGKILTEEDLNKSGDPIKVDTSSQTMPADQKLDQDGKIIVEEPEKKEPPKEEEVREEPLSKPSEEKKYKYASMDEYEKAYKEAERKMHEATTAKAALEKKLAQYEKPVEKLIPTEDERVAEITDEALAKIDALPVDSPTRNRDAAIIWGKAQRKISRLEIEETNRQVSSEREIVVKTYERAQKEGIKTDAELRILGYEFSKTDTFLGTDERINKAVENTKEILSQIRDGFVKNQQRDKEEKDDLKVLGRGSTRKEKSEEKETKPTTMSQQLSELNEKRRMTKEDLR